MGKGTDYAAGAKFNIEKDMELYAQWEKDASLWYHVTYDGNGSTTGVPTDTTEYVKNTPVTVKADKPTLANAVFLGWSTTQHALITKPDGSGRGGIREQSVRHPEQYDIVRGMGGRQERPERYP